MDRRQRKLPAVGSAGGNGAQRPRPARRRRCVVEHAAGLLTMRRVAPHLLLPARTATGPESLAEYRARGGYDGLLAARGQDPARLRAEVAASGLRGRGGAAFPTARKWDLAAAASADRKFVVANGGEHEPGSDKDRCWSSVHPHAVLEGLLARRHRDRRHHGYLYLIEDMHGRTRRASKRRSARPPVPAAAVPDRPRHLGPTTYVAGEETAALEAIEGRPAKPRKKPPFPGEAGLFGKPTTVNNVETLAHVAWIARHGAAAFAAIGTEAEQGHAAVHARPGEVASARRLRAAVRQHLPRADRGPRRRPRRSAAGCARCCRRCRAGFLTAEHLDVPIAYETLRPLGSSPGCGGVRLVARRHRRRQR
jgi:NADH:ubiquinone oxidoreductase subunit F (NADH-binding)